MASRRLLVDVHSHVYLPRYAALLRSRSTVPLIKTLSPTSRDERLLILDHEPSGGRPVGPQYWDREEKLKFMDRHGIDVTVVSTANPWLDFLPAPEAHKLAVELNQDLEEYCATSPLVLSSSSTAASASPPATGASPRRLYGFGLLPLVPSIPVPSLLSTISQVAALPHLRGLIVGTQGIGKGLDDPALDTVWGAIAQAGLVVFVHPHYGVDAKAWGEQENGHVLPLALGFPFETTIAITRLILAGVLDRFPSLKLLLAHSGGALPALSSRLASCITHDPIVASRLQHHDARHYIGKLYLDAVAYGPEELGFSSEVIGRAQRYSNSSVAGGSHDALDIAAKRSLGSRRMLFGTDHPFFPPLSSTEKWKSVVENLQAIEDVQGWCEEDKDRVRGGNAVELFGLGDEGV